MVGFFSSLPRIQLQLEHACMHAWYTASIAFPNPTCTTGHTARNQRCVLLKLSTLLTPSLAFRVQSDMNTHYRRIKDSIKSKQHLALPTSYTRT